MSDKGAQGREADSSFRILDVCEDLHMIVTGGVDLGIDRADMMARWLNGRISTWKPSALPRCGVYDGLVLALATTALREYETWRSTM